MKDNIKCYTNGILMFLGVTGYLLCGLGMKYDLAILLLGSIPLLFLFAYAFTIGGLISFGQIFYGVYKLCKTKEEKYKHHFYNAILWVVSYVMFYIGTVKYDIIVTV